MSPTRELLRRIESNAENTAMVYRDETYLYKDLLKLKESADLALREHNVAPGDVVALCADYAPASMALMLALAENNNIVVPISIGLESGGSQYLTIADPDFLIEVEEDAFRVIKRTTQLAKNALITQLVKQSRPGLVLFTSGTTGQPKAVLHDLHKLMLKFMGAAKRHTTLCFLMFDHIGGIDTYLYTLFSGGVAVFPESRDPSYVSRLIERHRVEVLPVSPTFLNLMLISGAHRQLDMSSLKTITLGSEKVSSALLSRAEREFSNARLVQKYGITEVGSPSSKTHPDDASLIRIQSESVEVRVVDGVLHLKTSSAMVGYLNADSPFTDDGWFDTGDAAEIHGDYVRILGRKSDLINVGGEKVFPAEIEGIILELDSVAEVTVFGEKNPIVGEMVCAKVRPANPVAEEDFVAKVKQHCAARLEKYKVPVKVTVSDERQHSDRFKKHSGSARAS